MLLHIYATLLVLLFATTFSQFVGNQLWDYIPETKAIVHRNTGMCLDKADASKDNTLPTLKRCDGRKSQRWSMHSNFKWQASNHEPSENEEDDET